MISLCFLIVGLLIGYFERSGRDKLAEMTKRLPEAEKTATGATDASYGSVNEHAGNQDGDVGISEPRTPQQLAWEEQERLKRLNEGVINGRH